MDRSRLVNFSKWLKVADLVRGALRWQGEAYAHLDDPELAAWLGGIDPAALPFDRDGLFVESQRREPKTKRKKRRRR